MKVNMIFCTNEKNYIGYRGELLYRFQEDLSFFKSVTQDNTVIMGFKTYQEIGKPLPNRVNIVVVNFKYPLPEFHKDIIVVGSLDEAYEKAEAFKDNETFIIGGGKLYKEAMEHDKQKISTIYMTVVDDDLEGDTKSPIIPYTFKMNLISEFTAENKIDNEYYLLRLYKLTI